MKQLSSKHQHSYLHIIQEDSIIL